MLFFAAVASSGYAPAFHVYALVYHAPACKAEVYADEVLHHTYTYAVSDNYSKANFSADETSDDGARNVNICPYLFVWFSFLQYHSACKIKIPFLLVVVIAFRSGSGRNQRYQTLSSNENQSSLTAASPFGGHSI